MFLFIAVGNCFFTDTHCISCKGQETHNNGLKRREQLCNCVLVSETSLSKSGPAFGLALGPTRDPCKGKRKKKEAFTTALDLQASWSIPRTYMDPAPFFSPGNLPSSSGSTLEKKAKYTNGAFVSRHLVREEGHPHVSGLFGQEHKRTRRDKEFCISIRPFFFSLSFLFFLIYDLPPLHLPRGFHVASLRIGSPRRLIEYI